MPSRVLIADDHELLRMGIRTMLSSAADIEVVGEARDGQEALALCRKLRPDLVLMDLSMPEMDWIEATRAIKDEFPETGVLVLTAHADHKLLLEAIRAGAAGYVLKGGGPTELVGSIRGSSTGSHLWTRISSCDCSGSWQRKLLRQRSHHPSPPPERSEGPPGAPLTPRELEVLRHLVTGKTNRQIARELHLSLSTVKRNLERIISKLGVSDRTQAAVKSVELGLIDPERAK